MPWAPTFVLAGGDFFSAPFLTLLFTYWAQSTLLSLLVLFATRLRRRHTADNRLWQRTAVLAPLVTSSAWLCVSWATVTSSGVELSAAPANGAAASSDTISAGVVLEVRGALAWLLSMALIVSFLLALERIRRLSLGIHRMRRVLRRRVPLSDTQANRLAKAMANSAGLEGTLLLSHSDTLASPVVVRAREICLPTRLLTTLSSDELKAVLAHEIAHLRRGDWLWFPLLSVLDAVLTLQPLNRLVVHEYRRDAERDCDQIAIQWTGDPRALARALMYAAEHAMKPRREAWLAGMATQPGETLARVQHLLRRPSVSRRPQRSSPFARLAPVAFAVAIAPWSTALALVAVDGSSSAVPHQASEATARRTRATPLRQSEDIDAEGMELARQRHYFESELQQRLWVEGEPEDSRAIADLRGEIARITELERALEKTE